MFASRENTLTEQRVLLHQLQDKLGAIDVTGLSAWGRARKVYGVVECDADDKRGLTPAPERGQVKRSNVSVRAGGAAPVSTESAAIPLFDIEGAA